MGHLEGFAESFVPFRFQVWTLGRGGAIILAALFIAHRVTGVDVPGGSGLTV